MAKFVPVLLGGLLLVRASDESEVLSLAVEEQMFRMATEWSIWSHVDDPFTFALAKLSALNAPELEVYATEFKEWISAYEMYGSVSASIADMGKPLIDWAEELGIAAARVKHSVDQIREGSVLKNLAEHLTPWLLDEIPERIFELIEVVEDSDSSDDEAVIHAMGEFSQESIAHMETTGSLSMDFEREWNLVVGVFDRIVELRPESGTIREAATVLFDQFEPILVAIESLQTLMKNRKSLLASLIETNSLFSIDEFVDETRTLMGGIPNLSIRMMEYNAASPDELETIAEIYEKRKETLGFVHIP
jgi:hypothetical protein